MTVTPDVVRHPMFARSYTRLADRAERRGQREHRIRLLSGCSGRVIEVGAGTGLNFAHYPSGVDEVVAVEPEPYLRARAQESAAEAAVAVRVVDGLADRLPAEDGSFDVAIASLLLCSVADQPAVLREMFRVIRPQGELRFYEHVVSARPMLAHLERSLSRRMYPRFVGGCHLDRDTPSAIERAGFQIETCERFAFTALPFPPRVSHVLGVARRP